MKYTNCFSYQNSAAPSNATADWRLQSVNRGLVTADAAAATSCFSNSFCMSPDYTDIPIILSNENEALLNNMNNQEAPPNLTSDSQESEDCNRRDAKTIRSSSSGCSTSAPLSRLASTCKKDQLVVASTNVSLSPSNTSTRNGYWSDEAIEDDKFIVTEDWHNDRVCNQKIETSESSTYPTSVDATISPLQQPSEFSTIREIHIIPPRQMEDDENTITEEPQESESTVAEPRIGIFCPNRFNQAAFQRLEPVVSRASSVEVGSASIRSRFNGAQALLQLLEMTTSQSRNENTNETSNSQQQQDRAVALLDLIQRLQSDDALFQKIQYSPKFIDDIFEYRFTMLPLNHPFVTESEDDVRLLSESEWRTLGIRQTRGWQHFGYSRHERNVLLFRRPLGTCPLTGNVSVELQAQVNNRLRYIDAMQNEISSITSDAEASIESDELPMYGSSSSFRWTPSNKNSRIALKRSIVAVTKTMDNKNLKISQGSPFFDLNIEDYTNIYKEEDICHRSKRHQSKRECQFTDNIDKLFLSMHMPLCNERF